MNPSESRRRAQRVGTAAVLCLGFLIGLLAAPPLAGATPPPHYVAGDFDGDGRVDVAVGAPGIDRVRVTYTSATPGGSPVALLQPITPGTSRSGFGTALALGDFNGDGRGDLAVGAPNYTTNSDEYSRGAIYLYLGRPYGLQAVLHPEIGPLDDFDPAIFGASLAATDTNGDGYTDLATARSTGGGVGYVVLFYGGAAGLDHATSFNAEDPNSVAFGDVDGDHHPELIATDDYLDLPHNLSGGLRVYRGSSAGIVHSQRRVAIGGDLIGGPLAGADLNHDGYSDVVVGLPWPGPGTVRIQFGGPNGLAATHRRTLGEQAVTTSTHYGDRFGSSLAIARLDADRYPELVVGAPHARAGSVAGAGAVYVLHGSSAESSTSSVQRFTQATPGVPGAPVTNAGFGDSLYLARLNTDTHTDLAIGAPNAAYGAPHGGLWVRLRGTASGLRANHGIAHGFGTAHARFATSIR